MPTLDLTIKENREALEKRILDDINAYCVKKYANEHRNHLGASVLGKPCRRELWYIFRWVKKENFDGRMLRLFQVGHNAEPRFIDYLRGIGFEVWESDPSTNKQFRITGAKGHYGGSLDAVCKAPAHYNLETDLVFLNEFKTNNTGAGFNAVADKSLSAAKPIHYAQMCQYGAKYQFKYGLYLIENKNDSSITPKIVPLDWNYGLSLEAKAEQIIFSQTPPERISDNKAYSDCKICAFYGVCHENEPVEINCRSCKLAKPIDDGEWFCSRFNDKIPPEFILKGCDGHSSINQ